MPRAKSQQSLKNWGDEDWGTKSGKNSTVGRNATGERYMPRKARESLSSAEYAATTRRKRRATRAGKQVAKNTPKAKAATRAARINPGKARSTKKTTRKATRRRKRK